MNIFILFSSCNEQRFLLLSLPAGVGSACGQAGGAGRVGQEQLSCSLEQDSLGGVQH